MENKIKIIVADDHPVLRKGLVLLLSGEKDLEVVGAASDGQQAFDLISQFKPDIAILDIDMPKLFRA